MEEHMKKRLIGATVLVSLAVIFVPMLLQPDPVIETGITESNIPPMPEGRFSSRIIPIENETPATGAAGSGQVERDTAAAPAPPPPPQPQPQPQAEPTPSAWVIQAGSFSSQENADTLMQELRAAGYPAFVDPAEIGGNTLHRVQIGPEASRGKAEEMLRRLHEILSAKKLEGALRSYP
ncbi:MAG: hypothetical protein C3L25_14055 [Candidatus Sedimenticola endophacoides]|uniref:SPOR domain-containing protein n=1 Tax=Candidatus Sedimenticola endophacoides TaxID=2548426 RepID=A0A6N4E485_9GAMM|nr:MAG: hypothetical protein B0D94_02960 [Candidatus Sedimenticola endophacoides]OQX41780.1 MAG: hypothetical protein B0D89_02990 [Candidatus Sedimenticola endophacoides]PUD97964.1 MAG: hypothetical protein C3L26_14135 [Candidatus Sedimenticola endophacoides]PUE00253.1 MAG: hypothetical protein C3L25_14055 [Candidatus Sedimenticola endophacoides]PUE04557.1 MAG: hypothetical protein C3L24_02960 [Candidatus Sedimenticola endophacoides]